MKVEQFVKAINYKIGEGSSYGWDCFGKNARYLDYDTEDNTECYISCIFDSKTQYVYSLEFHDYMADIQYRWIDKEYRDLHEKEQIQRGIDDNEVHDVELDDDMLEKIECFLLGKTYDRRIKVPLDLEDDELFQLMKIAHEKDITLNKLVENVIGESIEKYERDYE